MKDKNETYSYLGGLVHGIGSLLTGMKTTMTVFCRRKVKIGRASCRERV